MSKKFASKDPQEVLLLTFDFSEVIDDPTEVITGVTWTVTLSRGTDVSNPILMLYGTPAIDGLYCSHLVQLGSNDNDYLVSALVTTNKNQVIKLSGVLPVVTQS